MANFDRKLYEKNKQNSEKLHKYFADSKTFNKRLQKINLSLLWQIAWYGISLE